MELEFSYSNNLPVKSSDKESISNIPIDPIFILPIFDSLTNFLGKYVREAFNKKNMENSMYC